MINWPISSAVRAADSKSVSRRFESDMGHQFGVTP